jgi:pimeloyl-ACP methyl ester carboxylesterase
MRYINAALAFHTAMRSEGFRERRCRNRNNLSEIAMLKEGKIKTQNAGFHSSAFLFLLLLATNFGQTAFAQNSPQGKTPVIVIPGFVGSELFNQQTGERVWFRFGRSKEDDLRLPLSVNLESMRDNLAPRDALRSVKIGFLPRKQIYGSLIEALKNQGYEERSWESPKAKDALYVFAYDWRRDNVENARLLIEKIENLKRLLNQPNLKFNVVAHSMGGLITRYAAMYGAADLPDSDETPQLDWAGAKHFNRIVLIGTPNQGSLLALRSLADAFAIFPFNQNLPFVQKITKFDLFTMPAVFQLLPNNDAFKVFDENLRPLKIDIYDDRNWIEYGWGALNDTRFAKQFDDPDRSRASAYFLTVLKRAKRFQAALNNDSGGAKPISIFLIGADCKTTLDSIIVYRDQKNNSWKTLFKAKEFVRGNGKKASEEELKKILFAPGDGLVSKSSLLNDPAAPLGETPAWFQCEEHNFLVANKAIQARLSQLLK